MCSNEFNVSENEVYEKLLVLLNEKRYDDLRSINNSCSSYNGSAEEIGLMDEIFFERYYDNIMRLVRDICYGEVAVTDEYITYNGYGNLETFNKHDMEDYLDLDNIAYQVSSEKWIYNDIKDILDEI